MLHVDHHDAAYRWAARSRVEQHPRTNVVQIVHTEEVYREEVLERSTSAAQGPADLFEEHGDEYLLSLGRSRRGAIRRCGRLGTRTGSTGWESFSPRASGKGSWPSTLAKTVVAPEPVPIDAASLENTRGPAPVLHRRG